MAVCLLGVKPLAEPMVTIYHLDPKNKVRTKLIEIWSKDMKIFFQESALEYVICDMAAILSRPQC